MFSLMHELSAKDRARRDLRSTRAAFVDSLTAEARADAGAALAIQVMKPLADAVTVASYAPMGHEIDPAAVEAKLKAKILLPWFADRGSGMQFREKTTNLQPGPWGVMQPPHDAELLEPDALLVPLVGATVKGERLGQGQGHFDRCVAALRAKGPLLTIGLAWDCQIVDSIPTDPWDEVLDYIATPTALYASP